MSFGEWVATLQSDHIVLVCNWVLSAVYVGRIESVGALVAVEL